MKNTTKQFNTHFNFAILAIITVGFLLWHSIAIFNLEQELQSLQSNTAISKKASIQKDDTQGTETENTDTEILYNEDGSIDTSNWKTYTNEEYGFSVKYPEGWTSLDIPNAGNILSFGSMQHDKEVYNIRCHKLLKSIPAHTEKEKLNWNDGFENFKSINKQYFENENYIAFKEYSKLSIPTDTIDYGESISYRFLSHDDIICEMEYLLYDENVKSFVKEEIFDSVAHSLDI